MGKAFGTMIRSVYRNRRVLIIAVLLSAFSMTVCGADVGTKKLLLFAKNPATWVIVKGGAAGTMIYRETTGAFSLTAVGLAPRSFYAVIRPDEAAHRAEILSRGMSDGLGRLVLAGTWHNWAGKFWVVSGDDVTGRVGEAGTLKAWRPDRYLFEEKPLGIACGCPETEEPE